jgi:Capsular polysaccharide synthesis protein
MRPCGNRERHSAFGDQDEMTTKKIWLYWQQGWEHAPELVKQCAASWRLQNPDYEVHLLDQNSVAEYIAFPKEIDFRRKKLTVQKISNLTRLSLLSKYGGAWADASVFCNRPLGEWLEEYYGSHFFAFRNAAKDRLLSNWFLAAESDSVILQRLSERMFKYFSENSFSNQHTAIGKLLLKYFARQWNKDPRTTRNWVSWFARKVLRVYPYYIFHYIINDLLFTDPECAALWNQAKPFPAGPSVRLLRPEESEEGMFRAKREIDSRIAPMYKLTWRVDAASAFWTTLLQYLQEQSN